MEKLLHRTILNRNQLVNKARRESAKDLRKSWRDFNRMKELQDKRINQLVKSERIARREDWMLGPLAPKRDVGNRKETYGAVDNVLAQGAKLPDRELTWPRGLGSDATGSEDKRLPPRLKDKRLSRDPSEDWTGYGLVGNIAEGDKVVVLRGMGKGKVGEVTRIETGTNQVFVKDVNRINFKVPTQMLPLRPDQKVFEQEAPVSIFDVKLIFSIEDPQTGIFKDVVAREVYGGGPYTQREKGSNLPRHTRYLCTVEGTWTEDNIIPWPQEDKDRFYTQSVDTTRDLVEEVTYYPSISEGLPLVEGVIDELRAKHARGRKDWDNKDFMLKKMMQDARRDWFKERSQVLSEPFWTKEWIAKEKERRLLSGKAGQDLQMHASQNAKEVLRD